MHMQVIVATRIMPSMIFFVGFTEFSMQEMKSGLHWLSQS